MSDTDTPETLFVGGQGIVSALAVNPINQGQGPYLYMKLATWEGCARIC